MKEKSKFPGIVLEKDIAKGIYEKNIREIILEEPIDVDGDTNLYYMDKELCYGILGIKSLRVNGNKYHYEIKILDQFEIPKPIEVVGNKTFLETTKFLSEEEKSITLMEPYAMQKPKSQNYNLNKFIEEIKDDKRSSKKN